MQILFSICFSNVAPVQTALMHAIMSNSSPSSIMLPPPHTHSQQNQRSPEYGNVSRLMSIQLYTLRWSCGTAQHGTAGRDQYACSMHYACSKAWHSMAQHNKAQHNTIAHGHGGQTSSYGTTRQTIHTHTHNQATHEKDVGLAGH
jgi:hypothetical protein